MILYSALEKITLVERPGLFFEVTGTLTGDTITEHIDSTDFFELNYKKILSVDTNVFNSLDSLVKRSALKESGSYKVYEVRIVNNSKEKLLTFKSIDETEDLINELLFFLSKSSLCNTYGQLREVLNDILSDMGKASSINCQ